MPRRLKVNTIERGYLDVYAIVEDVDGTWESGWEKLRPTALGLLISRVTRSAFNHVLHGYSKPFSEALGVPPEGALAKLPSRLCAKERGCALYDKRKCITSSTKLPWCYEPADLLELDADGLRVASELVFLWREGVYVVAVYAD